MTNWYGNQAIIELKEEFNINNSEDLSISELEKIINLFQAILVGKKQQAEE